MPRKIVVELGERSNERWNYDVVRLSEVIRAFYGDPRRLWSTRRGRNVTSVVRSRIEKGQVIMARNSIFGDPLWGVVKVLVIEYYVAAAIKQSDLDAKQNAFTAGTGLSFNGKVLNADATQNELDAKQDAIVAGDGLTMSGTTLKADVTKNDLAAKQDAFVAGEGISFDGYTLRADVTKESLNASQEAIIAGSGLSFAGSTLHAEVTQNDLNGKQNKIAAGEGLSFSGTTLSAEVALNDLSTKHDAFAAGKGLSFNGSTLNAEVTQSDLDTLRIVVYDTVRDATVTLTMVSGGSLYSASGFFYKYNSEYYIGTAGHCAYPGSSLGGDRDHHFGKIYASISNYNNAGSHRVCECEVVGVAGYADIAILRLKNETLAAQKHLTFAPVGSYKTGDTCFVVGDPLGVDAVSISVGVIRDYKYTYENIVSSVAISAPTSPGNSGSPIVDSSGRIIALLSYGFDTSFGWGASSAVIEPVFAAMIATGSNFIGGTIGAKLYPVDAPFLYSIDKIPSNLEGYYVHNSDNPELTNKHILTHLNGVSIGLYHNQSPPTTIYHNPDTVIQATVLNPYNSTTTTISLSVTVLSVEKDTYIGHSSGSIKPIGPYKHTNA